MTLPYRSNVCILLFNGEKKLFLGERYGQPGVYQFPQGGVEDVGSIQENVLREIVEETGIPSTCLKIVRQCTATHTYDFDVVPQYAVGKWRGQRQTFWLVAFTGDDSHVNLDGEHPEFSSYRWCRPDEVRLYAEEKRRPGYEAPLREFEEFIKE